MVGLDLQQFASRLGTWASGVVGLTKRHARAADGAHPPVDVGKDRSRAGEEDEPNALPLRLVELGVACRKLGGSTPVDDGDLLRTEAYGASRRVQRHVAAAQHHDRSGSELSVVGAGSVGALEVLGRGEDADKLLPWDPGHDRPTDADGDEDRIESLTELLQRARLADANAELEVDTQCAQALDLGVHHLVRKPVCGDAVAEHAAGGVVRVEDGHRAPARGKLPGACEASWSGADDRHPEPGCLWRFHWRPILARPLRHEALDRADRNDAFGLRPLA